MIPTPIFPPFTFSKSKIGSVFWVPLLGACLSFLGRSELYAHEIVMSQPAETQFSVAGIRPTHLAWIEMIKSAKTSILIEQFYVSSKPGSLMEEVLSALKQAAKTGVEVKLLVDSKFYDKYPEVPNELAKLPSFSVKTINFGKGVQHAKYFIVDDRVMYSGSANFDWLALEHIHETGLVLEDRAVIRAFTELFESDWKKGEQTDSTGMPNSAFARNQSRRPGMKSRTSAPQNESSGFIALASPPGRLPKGISPTLNSLVETMDQAQQSLKIQLYQYSTRGDTGSRPWLALDSALRAAAGRGVKIQLLIDEVALKSAGSSLKSLSTVPNIEIKRVSIPDWSGGKLDHARLVHSKYLIADTKKAWLGSENWRENYFYLTRNIGILFTQAKLVEDLNSVFEKAWKSPFSHAL